VLCPDKLNRAKSAVFFMMRVHMLGETVMVLFFVGETRLIGFGWQL
jgi:hypothetical protein